MIFQKQRAAASKYSGRWFWTLDSQKAADVLAVLKPFLAIKTAEVDVALRFQATKRVFTNGRSRKLGLTAEEIAEREFCYIELQRLKRVHNDPAVQAAYSSTT